MKLKVILAGIALLASTSSMAAHQWIPWGKVKQVYVNSLQNALFIKMEAETINPEGCPKGNDFYAVPFDDPKFDSYVSILLAAKATDTLTSLYIYGCDPKSGRGKVSAARIQ